MKFLKFTNIKGWIVSHKKTSILILLILVLAGYKLVQALNSTTGETRYVISTAKKGTITSTITGTGQVSASNRVDVASEVSGDVTAVPVKLGSVIKTGQTIAYLDSRNATRAVENAELSLENAKITYEKAIKQSKEQASGSSVSDLKGAYDLGYNEVVNTFINLPDILDGMDAIFYDPNHSKYFSDLNINSSAGQTAIDYKYEAGKNFDQSKKAYDLNLKTYKTTSLNSNPEKIISLIEETHAVVKKLSSALTGTYNTIDYIKARITSDIIPTEIATDKNTISSYITKVNNHTTNLSTALSNIEDAKDSATTATLDLKSAQLDVSEAEDALREARETLGNHSIKAPFDGVIGKVSVETGDKVSVNTAVATMITDEKIAEVSLNEIDVAKIKLGDKASVTFDAVDDLSITGEIIEIDLLGTVEQGVVSYVVKIAFDVNDERVRTGMSLSASITTDTKQDVLIVPNSAIKSQGNVSYVETLSQDLMQNQNSGQSIISLTPPKTITVQVGLSNDEYTEIISGLNEGDKFISRTTTQSSTQTTAQAPSLFGGGANRNAGTSNTRFQTR